MSSNDSQKLDPRIYLEAARYIESGEVTIAELALNRAAYRLYGLDDFKLSDLVHYIGAWKKEFERVPSMFVRINDYGNDWTQERRLKCLLRMAYLAEKEDEKSN